MSSSKKIYIERDFATGVYRLEIQSCWYFRPSFGNCCPSNHLSGSSLGYSRYICDFCLPYITKPISFMIFSYLSSPSFNCPHLCIFLSLPYSSACCLVAQSTYIYI